MSWEPGDWYFGLLANDAGIICVAWRGFSLDLGVERRAWGWGYEEDWYDGPLPSIGLGPLFLFCWVYSIRESIKWTSGE